MLDEKQLMELSEAYEHKAADAYARYPVTNYDGCSNGIRFRTESNEDGSVKCFADFSGFVRHMTDLMSNRMTDEILDGCEAELNRHGWFKERTCELEKVHEWGDEWEPFGYVCKSCEEAMPRYYGSDRFGNVITPNYCPNCGAKVVE